MNTTAATLLIALASAAASLLPMDGVQAAEAKPQIVKLERVVIEGRRAQVVKLPTVVVEGRRQRTADELQLAKAGNCKTSETC
ncbi:hypothetical protein [Pelomonas sp. KK5]|uniref:hypothetical protein n=1 Tax=Pelomonas sp. KK5 TaxID=1855730 RepID=UPI00097C650A|nr:hypothetical protein [Pelomonas sp. KK5]